MEKNKKAYTVFAWAALCLLAFTFIFPLYWIVTGSFKLQTATVQLPPQWFPAEPTAANYVKLFKNPAGLWLWNSVFQAAMATLLTCFTAWRAMHWRKSDLRAQNSFLPFSYVPWHCQSRW